MKLQVLIVAAILLIIASVSVSAETDVGIKYVNHLLGEINRFMFAEDGKCNKQFLATIDSGVAKEKEYLVKRMGKAEYEKFRNGIIEANAGSHTRSMQKNIMDVLVNEVQRVLDYKYKKPAHGETYHYPAVSCAKVPRKEAHIAWVNPSMNDASSTLQQLCSNGWGIVGKVGTSVERNTVNLFSANINEGQLYDSAAVSKKDEVAFFSANTFSAYGANFVLSVQDGKSITFFRPADKTNAACTLATLCKSSCACQSATSTSNNLKAVTFDSTSRPMIPATSNTLVYAISATA